MTDLEKIKLAIYTTNIDSKVASDLLNKYDILASAASVKTATVDDVNSYNVIMNRTLFLGVVSGVNMTDIMRYDSLYKLVSLAMQRNSGKRTLDTYIMVYKTITENTGLTPVDSVTPETVESTLQTFGIEQADPEVAEEVVDNFDTGAEEAFASKGLFDSDEDDALLNEMFGDEEENTGFEEDGTEESESGPDSDEDDALLNEMFGDEDDGIEDSEGEDTGDDLEISEEDLASIGLSSEDFEDGEINIKEKNDEPEEEELTQEAKDKLEMFKEIYNDIDNSPLKAAVNGIVMSLSDLYESCYSGITATDGVLTDQGLLSVDRQKDGHRQFVMNHSASDKDVRALGKKANYLKYYSAVMYAIGVAGCGAVPLSPGCNYDMVTKTAVARAEQIFGKRIDGRKDTTPKFADVKDHVQLYPRLHTEFMTGMFVVNSKMKQWALDNKAKHSDVRITNFGDMTKWMKERVTDCLAQACLDAGAKVEDAGVNDSIITSVCNTMASSIKNIIVITNSKKSHKTIKICSAMPLNAEYIGKEIANYFNAGSASSQAVEVITKNNGSNTGVLEYDIILDKADYDKSSAFSADVIDSIIESGNVPSWSNAILGEKDNGGVMNFNFKDKCSVAIYGASGSGKGIMTSALLTNAMADGCDIFYFDGKPDNGAALAKVAWDENAGDVAVFNGCQGGSNTFPGHLEEYSHGVRNKKLRDMEEKLIPTLDDNKSWPFRSKFPGARKDLLEVSYTLCGFQFVHDAILLRSNPENLEMLPCGDPRWAVFVIDEIEDAAVKEQTTRSLMKAYMESVGERECYKTESKTDRNGNVTTTEKKDGKIKDPKNWKKDPGYLFCKQWLEWVDSRCLQWQTIVTKALRNSSTTLITIFQSNNWLNQNKAGNTKIGSLMLKVAQKTTKIVGKGALVSTNTWGDQTSYAWKDEVAKGKWAIATGESGLSDDATIFKPFKVFTTDLGAGVKVPFDDYGAGSQNCWTDSFEGHKGNKPLGLQSYVKYMFNGLAPELQAQANGGRRLPETLTPAGVLVSSFTYLSDLVAKNPGLFQYNNLYDCMYKVSMFEDFTGDMSDDDIRAAEAAEGSEGENGTPDIDSYNFDMDDQPLENSSMSTGNMSAGMTSGVGNNMGGGNTNMGNNNAGYSRNGNALGNNNKQQQRMPDAQLRQLILSVIKSCRNDLSRSQVNQLVNVGMKMFRKWGW